jgi:hypothetical protein
VQAGLTCLRTAAHCISHRELNIRVTARVKSRRAVRSMPPDETVRTFKRTSAPRVGSNQISCGLFCFNLCARRLAREVHGRGHHRSERIFHMGQQVSSAKSPRKGRATRTSCLPPCCRELEQQFAELKLVRHKVKAAEDEQARPMRKTR